MIDNSVIKAYNRIDSFTKGIDKISKEGLPKELKKRKSFKSTVLHSLLTMLLMELLEIPLGIGNFFQLEKMPRMTGDVCLFGVSRLSLALYSMG